MRSKILYIFNFREVNQNLLHVGLGKLYPVKFMSTILPATAHMIHCSHSDL